MQQASKSAPDMQLVWVQMVMFFVKKLKGKTISIKMYPSKPAEYLKEVLQDREGIPADQQRLIFAGRDLPDGYTLRQHKVVDESTMHLTLRPRGGTDSMSPTGSSKAASVFE